MKRLLLMAALSTVLVIAWPLAADAAEEALSPAEVVVMSPSMDGSAIVVEGEAVGDVLRTMGGGKWLNVLGDEVGLGMWATEDMLEPIEYLGSYKYDGDYVRVTGTLHMTCEQHGGEFDVHAESIEILSVGGPRTHDPVPMRGLVGLVGMVLGGGLLYRYRELRE